MTTTERDERVGGRRLLANFDPSTPAMSLLTTDALHALRSSDDWRCVIDRGTKVVDDPASGPGLRYRRDIQGIRAIAVVAVLLYHAGVPAFGGGYIGVDVFFVISGFLITGLIVKEVRSTDRFRPMAFYARRARRLLPASAVVLVATSLITVAVLPATRWESIARDIGASALYVVNWRFAFQSVDYLASGAAASPVLHFWSLAVEEQFYVLWPMLLLALLAVWRKMSWSLERVLLVGIALVSIPSLVWSVYLTSTSPGPAFFVTTTRVWEFGIGAALALAIGWISRLSRPALSVAGIVGVGSIVATMFLFNDATPFPGVAALVPTLGTAALIMSGVSSDDGLVQRALGVRPMQWLGALSYSVYLWHWPLVVGATWMWGVGGVDLPPWIGLLVVTASFVPAWISYRLVEEPIHHSAAFSRIPKRALGLGVACTAAGVAAAVFVGMSIPDAGVLTFAEAPEVVESTSVPPTSVGEEPASTSPGGTTVAPGEPTPTTTLPSTTTTPDVSPPDTVVPTAGGVEPVPGFGAGVLGDDPANDPDLAVVDSVAFIAPSPVAALSDKALLGGEKCIGDPEDAVTCDFGPADAEVVVAIVGDSKIDQWLPAIEMIAIERGWRLVTYLGNGCPLVRIQTHTDRSFQEVCTAYNEQRYATLLGSDDIDFIVTSQRKPMASIPGATFEQNVQAMVDDLQSTWTDLEAVGIGVIVIPDNAPPPVEITDCVSGNSSELSACAFSFPEAYPKSAAPVQYKALAGLSDVGVADVQAWICGEDTCPAVIGNALVYRQGSHLTATYITTLAYRLDVALVTAMNASS